MSARKQAQPMSFEELNSFTVEIRSLANMCTEMRDRVSKAIVIKNALAKLNDRLEQIFNMLHMLNMPKCKESTLKLAIVLFYRVVFEFMAQYSNGTLIDVGASEENAKLAKEFFEVCDRTKSILVNFFEQLRKKSPSIVQLERCSVIYNFIDNELSSQQRSARVRKGREQVKEVREKRYAKRPKRNVPIVNYAESTDSNVESDSDDSDYVDE